MQFIAINYIKYNLFLIFLGGFFSCQMGEMVYGHTYNGEKSKGYTLFKFKRLSDKSVQRALEVVHLSDQIIDIQRKYVGAFFMKMLFLMDCTVT